MTTSKAHSLPGETESTSALGRTEQKATVVGSLAGGLAGAAFIYAAFTPLYLRYMALVLGIGPGSKTRGVIAFMAVAAFFGLFFGGFAARHVSTIAGNVMAFAKSTGPTRTLLGPFFQRAPLTTTTTLMGLVYGAVVGPLVGRVLVPALVVGATPFGYELSATAPEPILGFIVYGGVLGFAYGRVVEREGSTDVGGGTLLGGHRGAVVFSSLLGGFLGGGVVYQAGGAAQMLYYGSIVGSAGSVPQSWAVWMVTTFLLGLLFVRYVRPRDESPGYLWRSTRRGLGFGVVAGLVVGGVLVPALVTATTSFELSIPHLNPMVLAGYTLFGGVVGAGFGASFESEPHLGAAMQQTKGIVFGSLLGGLLGGVLVHNLAGPVYLQFFGSLFGVEGSIAKSWASWLVVSLVFGAVFARILARKLDTYLDSFAAAAENNPDLAATLGPAMERAPVTTTATCMGLAYGAVLAAVVGALVLPFVVSSFTAFTFPFEFATNLAYLFGFVVYGGFLGAGYGAIVES